MKKELNFFVDELKTEIEAMRELIERIEKSINVIDEIIDKLIEKED